uniref:Uncharacterized protein n=1 Tax=Arundo donax TaxID=35708 RepID=A0A0A8YF04_ARUDO
MCGARPDSTLPLWQFHHQARPCGIRITILLFSPFLQSKRSDQAHIWIGRCIFEVRNF